MVDEITKVVTVEYDNEGNGGFHEWVVPLECSFLDIFEELGIRSVDKIKCEITIKVLERT